MINKVLAFGALTAALAVPAVAHEAPMDKSKSEMQQHQSMPSTKDNVLLRILSSSR